MKFVNRSISMLFVLILLMTGMTFAMAEQFSFDDVAKDSWYYEGVMTMAQYGVITGYPDGKFLPQNKVSREEFAVMMVRALQLGKSGGDSSFEDVTDDYWAVPYLESAKRYLTGYKTSTGIAFKPKNDAVREDMAVALVKALDYNVSKADLDVLNQFKDKNQISDNLKPYVAMAYEKKLIKGSQENNGLYFNPTKTLTRAEAAVLLLSVIEEEKIVFDDEKIVLEEGDYSATRLSVEVDEDTVYLKWQKIEHEDFIGYKVVVSKYDSTPSYPDNGYMSYFTDKDVTRVQLKTGQSATDSDFNKLEAGERYYATITALYEDGKKTSNVVSFVLGETPQADYVRPSLTIETDQDEAKLFWTEINHPEFKYYKVVVSMKDPTPSYPENGYMYVISDPDENDCKIEIGDKGNESDFEKITADQVYYVSISAVYKDKVLTSNVVRMKLVEEVDDEEAYMTPVLTMTSRGNRVLFDWSKIDHDDFKGYKVVVSASDKSPSYPDNGYMTYITDKDDTSYEVAVGSKGYNSDFVKLESGKWYYAAITALYEDENTVSNTVKFMLDAEEAESYATPTLEVKENGDSVKLNWTRMDHSDFQGYKVVISDDNATPKYPDDGYMKYITNKDETSFEVKADMKGYNTDFSSIDYDRKYYASITVLYKDGKTYSNTVNFKLKAPEEEEQAKITPTVTIDSKSDDQIKLKWTEIDHPKFQGYKVVVSRGNATPQYPNDGYMVYITDATDHDYAINLGDQPNGGDFEKIEENVTYFASITVLYDDERVTSNVVRFELGE